MKEAGVDGDAQRADERNRSRRGREGLNFNPRVTEFTDICTRIRLAVAHSFSETTLSLLSIPKTYSSSYICRWMRPFSLEGRERKKKNTQKSKLNCMCWIRVMPAWQFATLYVLKNPLVYCMHSYGRINKGGEKKNDMWQAIHLSCQHVIFTNSNLMSTARIPSLVKVT